MKHYLYGLCIFILALVFIPMVSMINKEKPKTKEQQDFAPIRNYKVSADSTYKIFDIYSKDVIEIPVRDYLIGAVFAQMPADFCEEALKAQAVISHTYIIRQRAKQNMKPDSSLNGADISNDLNAYLPFYTVEQAKTIYKDKYREYYLKISKCVDEVINKVILYNGEPIVASYHSMSAGMTESAEVAWNVKVPYLVSVESFSDVQCDGFLDVKYMTSDEMYARLTQGLEEVTLSDDKTSWLKINNVSEAGMVLDISVGGKQFKGSEIRELLTIRSPFYTISYEGDKFKIEAKGYGHGVGLSQYGANDMALKGNTYENILNHYYTSIEIKDLV